MRHWKLAWPGQAPTRARASLAGHGAAGPVPVSLSQLDLRVMGPGVWPGAAVAGKQWERDARRLLGSGSGQLRPAGDSKRVGSVARGLGTGETGTRQRPVTVLPVISPGRATRSCLRPRRSGKR